MKSHRHPQHRTENRAPASLTFPSGFVCLACIHYTANSHSVTANNTAPSKEKGRGRENAKSFLDSGARSAEASGFQRGQHLCASLHPPAGKACVTAGGGAWWWWWGNLMWKAVLDRVTIQLLSHRLLCDWTSGWLKKTKIKTKTVIKKKKREKGGVCAKVTGLTVTAEHLPERQVNSLNRTSTRVTVFLSR